MALRVVEVNEEYVKKWGLEQFINERPGTRAIVAVDMEDAVGGLFFTNGYITHVHVCEPFRRGGFGSRLLEYVQEIMAKNQELKAVVGDHNPEAQAFFLKNGFRYAGRSILGKSTASLLIKKPTFKFGTDHADREAVLSTAINEMCNAMFMVEVAPIRIK